MSRWSRPGVTKGFRGNPCDTDGFISHQRVDIAEIQCLCKMIYPYQQMVNECRKRPSENGWSLAYSRTPRRSRVLLNRSTGTLLLPQLHSKLHGYQKCESCGSYPQTSPPRDTSIPSVLPEKSLLAVNRPCEGGWCEAVKLGGAACTHGTTFFRML